MDIADLKATIGRGQKYELSVSTHYDENSDVVIPYTIYHLTGL